MKKIVHTTLRMLPLVVIMLITSAFTPPNEIEAERPRVLIDGKEINPNKQLILQRDDTVYLEAYGIKPNSVVHLVVKKAGIRWVQDDYTVDKTGTVKSIMNVPEQKLKVTCIVSFYDQNGEYHEEKIRIKIV